MTTNSPNPVDGDVQALIADCKSEIKHLEDRIAYCNKYEVGLSDYESQLKRQKIALAALTAEPYAYASRNIDISKESQYFSASVFNNAWGDEYTVPLYTTPPAQLLRPVELPGERKWHEDDEAEDDTYNCGWNNGIKACAEALRQQGYEVKND